MSYYTESQKPISEKITLVTCEASERLKLFNLNGGDYERTVDNFVVGVKNGSTLLTVGTLPLSLNQYFFNPVTKLLTIDVGANPKTQNIIVTYRFFFSTAPLNLPYDLASGEVVEWEPLINNIGSIGQKLDDENTGIVLESSSTVEFISTSGRFDDIYDRLIWENKEIKFYSWFPSIPISQRVQLFSGVIESKDFSETKITFKVKDFVFKLKNKLKLGEFSDSDGDIIPAMIGKPKRRIYGQADHVKCLSLDATLGGYSLTGLVSGTGTAITGVGTLFLDEVSPGDEIYYIVNDGTYKIGIDSVNSDTSMTVGEIVKVEFSGLSVKNNPEIPWRKKNREWFVANHKLSAPVATISDVLGANKFVVDSTLNFFSGDEIEINGQFTLVKRVSGNQIITATNIVPAPIVSDTVNKLPIKRAFFGSKELTYSRDFSEINTTLSKLIIDDLAEFNITEQRNFDFTFTFTNGTRSIATSAAVDLKTIVSNRDWIRSSSISEPTWYEILEVKEQEILLRTVFTGASGTKNAYYKNVEYLNEDSLITVNCSGMEVAGNWMKTASDCVRNLVLNDAEFSSVSEASFTKADAGCEYIISLVIPENLDGDNPIVRDIITKINESVFGALYGDSSQAVSYSIFNATKPEILDTIKDDDVLSFSIATSQRIINECKVNFRPYVDIFSGENTFKTVSHTSDFVNKMIGIKNTTEKTIYLYEEDKAIIIAQRICFFNSLSSSVVTLKSKMNLSTLSVNDKLYLSLDRLFKRYSGSQKKRIGIVSGITRDGFNTSVQVSDLGNIYNRVMSIAPNSTPIYASATEDDKLKWGYVSDNDTETPSISSEENLGSNLIG